MKESNWLAACRIRACDVRSFMAIAVKTGKSEIVEHCLPAVLTSDDMINVKGQRVEGGGKMTVFTSVAGSLPDVPDDVPVHG